MSVFKKTILCPFCGEEVRNLVDRCGHCGYGGQRDYTLIPRLENPAYQSYQPAQGDGTVNGTVPAGDTQPLSPKENIMSVVLEGVEGISEVIGERNQKGRKSQLVMGLLAFSFPVMGIVVAVSSFFNRWNKNK